MEVQLMEAYLSPPRQIPFYIRLGLSVTRKITGKDLLPAKLLAWFPKAAIGSGVLESLIAKDGKDLDGRLLKLVRIQVSLMVGCAFCIDMNAFAYEKFQIQRHELEALRSGADPADFQSFTLREQLAIRYTRLITATPAVFPPLLIEQLKSAFSEREIVILATTAAQVNYWARLIHSFGVPPAGFNDHCDAPPFPDV
jgi:AhpD family alkylhydroperoxidase